jgi:hypothetical protein
MKTVTPSPRDTVGMSFSVRGRHRLRWVKKYTMPWKTGQIFRSSMEGVDADLDGIEICARLDRISSHDSRLLELLHCNFFDFVCHCVHLEKCGRMVCG